MRVTLECWRPDFAAALAGTIGDRLVQDTLRDGIPYPYTTADAEAFIGQMRASDANRLIAFAIVCDGTLCGSISVTRQSNVHFRTGELGYYVARTHWGRGIASEAVRQICAYVFAHTDIIRIFAEPFAGNAASCRVLEKNGFVREGTLRQNAVKNGRVLDMYMYARLRSDTRRQSQ